MPGLLAPVSQVPLYFIKISKVIHKNKWFSASLTTCSSQRVKHATLSPHRGSRPMQSGKLSGFLGGAAPCGPRLAPEERAIAEPMAELRVSRGTRLRVCGSSDLAMPLLMASRISSSQTNSGAWRCRVRVTSAAPGTASREECWLEGVCLFPCLSSSDTSMSTHSLRQATASTHSASLWSGRGPICPGQRPVQASPSSQSVSPATQPLSNASGTLSGLAHAGLHCTLIRSNSYCVRFPSDALVTTRVLLTTPRWFMG